MSESFLKRVYPKYSEVEESETLSLAAHIHSQNPHPNVPSQKIYTFDTEWFATTETATSTVVSVGPKFMSEISALKQTVISYDSRILANSEAITVNATHIDELTERITGEDGIYDKINGLSWDIIDLDTKVQGFGALYVLKSERFSAEKIVDISQTTESETGEVIPLTSFRIRPGEMLRWKPLSTESKKITLGALGDRDTYGMAHLFLDLPEDTSVETEANLTIVEPDKLASGKMNHLKIEFLGVEARAYVIDSWSSFWYPNPDHDITRFKYDMDNSEYSVYDPESGSYVRANHNLSACYLTSTGAPVTVLKVEGNLFDTPVVYNELNDSMYVRPYVVEENFSTDIPVEVTYKAGDAQLTVTTTLHFVANQRAN